MTVAGHQEYWQVGAKAYIQRLPIENVVQPLVDIGTITNIAPSLTPNIVRLLDPGETGFNRVAAEALTEIIEAHEITFANLNAHNRALLFLATAPELFTQLAVEKSVLHTVHQGHLVKLKEGTTSHYSLSAFAGFSLGTPATAQIQSIDKETRTVTLSSPLDSPNQLDALPSVIITGKGLANKANAGTYTIEQVLSLTQFIVVEDFEADETIASPYGELLYDDGTSPGATILSRDKWAIPERGLDRGVIQLLDIDGGVTTTGQLTAHYSLSARSGKHMIRPQSGAGAIQADVWIYFARSNGRMTVRHARASIAPSGTSFSAGEFSTATITVTILSDVTEVEAGVGELLDIVGSALPES